MRNLVLTVAFEGTAYHGWQVQKNAATVQETLQDALARVLCRRPPLTGCSRTDAGVHARQYVCNFPTENEIPCASLVRALNSLLPEDIAVLGCAEAPPSFHARYSAVGKEYLYRVDNGPVRDPFLRRIACFYPRPIDEDRLRRVAAAFVGRHDFRAFRAAGGKDGETVRTVTSFSVAREGNLVLFAVAADGFLYNMVRIMAGTLLAVAEGKIAEDALPGIIESGRRSAAGPTAPARGLTLNRVFYHDFTPAGPEPARAQQYPGLSRKGEETAR